MFFDHATISELVTIFISRTDNFVQSFRYQTIRKVNFEFSFEEIELPGITNKIRGYLPRGTKNLVRIVRLQGTNIGTQSAHDF